MLQICQKKVSAVDLSAFKLAFFHLKILSLRKIDRQMEKLLYLILFCFAVCSCNFENAKDESKVKEVVQNFYSAVNNRNYTLIEELCHPHFLPEAIFLRSLGDDLVRYRKVNIICTKIDSIEAEISAEVEDINGFFMIMDWILIKKEGEWKIKNLNYGFLLSGKEKLDSILYSEEGIYMPENDPNMIPFAEDSTE